MSDALKTPFLETVEVWTCPICRSKFGDKVQASRCIRDCTRKVEEAQFKANCKHQQAKFYFDSSGYDEDSLMVSGESVTLNRVCRACNDTKVIRLFALSQTDLENLWNCLPYGFISHD